TTTSYSRASCSRLVSPTQSTSWLVTPAIAETTTATSLPASVSRFTRLAAFLMRSISRTEVPPNFWTMRAMLRPEESPTKPPIIIADRKARIHTLSVLGQARRGERRRTRPGRRRSGDEMGRTARRQTIATDSPAAFSTVDRGELARFAAVADAGWDLEGKLKPLHRMNPVRLAFLRDRLIRHFGRDAAATRPFAGLGLLDIGCGGGLVAEPMTRLGFAVTGIDAAAGTIGTAQAPARPGGPAP